MYSLAIIQVLRYLAQIDQGGYLVPLRSKFWKGISKIWFLHLMSCCGAPTWRPDAQDGEDTWKRNTGLLWIQSSQFIFETLSHLTPKIEISLLQCRPQSHIKETTAHLPQTLYTEDIVFSTRRMVPQGTVNDICYVIFVSPKVISLYPLLQTGERSGGLWAA
jgi:hypothetical protein